MNFFTELAEGLSISWGAIRANKMRSVLTTLGIIIGIVTVTLMGTAIEGLNQAFVNSISFIGADVLYLQKTEWMVDTEEDWLRMQKRPDITLAEAGELERTWEMARAVTPVCFTQRLIKYGKGSASGVMVLGSTDQLFITGGISIAQGRFFSAAEADGGRPVCVIGADVATNLFTKESPLGHKVEIGQKPFEVVGVLDRQGGLFGNFDNQAIVPLSQFRSAFEHRLSVDQIQVKVKDVTDVENAREELRSVFRRIRRLDPSDQDNFAINQQDMILGFVHKVTGTIGAVGLFITGLSLFVGGIGIMNIMFVSVAERTREIGIRKAIGAKRRTILIQFLIEAASICLIGGLIGLGLAWPLTLVVAKFLPAVMSLTVVSIALGVSLLVGVLSGFFPAWRAARMNPVDALRNE